MSDKQQRAQPEAEAQYECADCQHPLGEHDGDGECWHRTHENTCPCDRGPVKPVEPAPPRLAGTGEIPPENIAALALLEKWSHEDVEEQRETGDYLNRMFAEATPEQGNADAAEAPHHWIAELAVVWSDWGIFAQCRREEGEENEADIYEQCRETIRAIYQKHAAFDEAGRTSGEKPLTDEERQWLQTYREKKAQGFGPSWINLTPVERPSFSIDEDGDL